MPDICVTRAAGTSGIDGSTPVKILSQSTPFIMRPVATLLGKSPIPMNRRLLGADPSVRDNPATTLILMLRTLIPEWCNLSLSGTKTSSIHS